MFQRYPFTHRIRAWLCIVTASLLVLSTAVGCTSIGAPTEPTEPTTEENVVYEKLKAAAQEINRQEAYHFKCYITNIAPSEADPTQYDYIEGWVSGEDMYTEQIHLGTVTPQFLHYDGSIYIHRSDNIWSPATDSSTDADTYRVTVPSRSRYTMTWMETGGYLDISFVEIDNPGAGVEIRLDDAGHLVWYAPYIRLGSAEGDAAPSEVRMYTVLIYHDTDPAEIRSHLDRIAPPLIDKIEFFDPATTPTGYPEGQIQRNVVCYRGNLYVDVAEVPGESVPDTHTFFGLIAHTDPASLPMENFHATHIPVGTDIYADLNDNSYIYYWQKPHAEYKPRRMERLDLAGLSFSDLTGNPEDNFLVVFPGTSSAPPSHLFPFIYRDDPGGDQDSIGPNNCKDGYLYVKNRNTGEIIQLLDKPVDDFAETINHIFCVTEDNQIIQVDYSGKYQRTLYQASAEISDIFYRYSKLYFNDGTKLMVLDLSTLTATIAGSFPDYQTIYAVSETWLWLNVYGIDYAYDIGTGNLVQFRNYHELNRFLEGTWPGFSLPTEVLPLPEDYTVRGLVGAYTEDLRWECGLQHAHHTPFSIPVIYPFSQDAIAAQEEIYYQWLPMLEEQKNDEACAYFVYVNYEAAINDQLLSIVVHYLSDFGTHIYQVYNFDLATGNFLTTAEMLERYLPGTSYPEFLMAVAEYRMDELQAKYPEINPQEHFYSLAPDVSTMHSTAIYLDADGQLCLKYHRLELGGAAYYATTTPFSLEDVDWDRPTREEAYQWLFHPDIPDEDISNGSTHYWSMLNNAYFANPEEFQAQLALADEATRQRIGQLLLMANPSGMDAAGIVQEYCSRVEVSNGIVGTPEGSQEYYPIASQSLQQPLLAYLEQYNWTYAPDTPAGQVTLALLLKSTYYGYIPTMAPHCLEILLDENGQLFVAYTHSGTAARFLLTPKDGTAEDLYPLLSQLIEDHVR